MKKAVMGIFKVLIVIVLLISVLYMMFFVAFGDTNSALADWGIFRLSVIYTVVIGAICLINE